jgi:hypothetical protein
VSSTGGSFGSGSGVASGGARSGVGDGFDNGSAGLGCDFVTGGPDLRVAVLPTRRALRFSIQHDKRP